MLDYMDRALGQPPETARKRLRVARALGDLPELSAALETSELSFCHVRELVRVATGATERLWVAAARGKSSREIEDLVTGRRPGDLPEDPADPEATTHIVRFEVSASTFALLRETRLILDEEHGRRLDDDELVAMLCEGVRDGGGAGRDDAGGGGRRAASAGVASARSASTDGRAKFQIALTVCERCEQGWQTGGGVQVPVDAATVERARCDAQHIGSIDGDAPERAYQDIPPSVARFVWARDHGRCQTPGCRSARGLELHHIVHRAHGGTHEPSNLTLRCSACHAAHHAGLLAIRGTAPDAIVTTRLRGDRLGDRADDRAGGGGRPAGGGGAADGGRPSGGKHGSSSAQGPGSAANTHHRPESAGASHQGVQRADAIAALCALGWKRGIATPAVDEAMGHVGHDADLADLIRDALRRCPRGR